MNKSQYETEKHKMLYGRCTLDNLRSEIRMEFKDRIRTLRSKQVDTHRHILERNLISDVISNGFDELQATLLTDKEAVALLDADAVLKLLNDVKEDLLREELEVEAEAHENSVQQETRAIVEHLLNVCNICENFVDEQNNTNYICSSCANTYFNNTTI